MTKQTPYRRIALLLDMASPRGAGLIEGIRQFARPADRWTYMINPSRPSRVMRQLRTAGCDGVIAALNTAPRAKFLRSLDLPTVNVADSQFDEGFVTICEDNEAVGRVAAEHLRQTGVEHYAYLTPRSVFRATQLRLKGFQRAVERAGFACHVYQPRTQPHDPWAVAINDLSRWLVDLPKPCGLLAADDLRACDAIEAAHRAPVNVPNEVAILGVGNDENLANLTLPPLSSVKLPHRRIGYEAAAALKKMISGQTIAPQRIVFEPMGVDAKLSSDLTAIGDDEVAAAIRFIRDHAGRPIQVSDLLEAVPISRRSLERRFRAVLDRTPQQEIQRVHLEHAQSLLADTDLSVPEVARQSGFKSADRLAAVFRRTLSITPTAYRRRCRKG